MKTLQTKSALLTLLVVGFVSLFAVGCGDSRDNFVITGNNNNNNAANTGNLLFRFQRAAAQEIVPAGTVNLRFDLFSANPGTTETLVLTETRQFAETVRLDNVPANVVFVAVTALTADSLPAATLVGPASVVVGADNEVNLGDATPVTFDAVTVAPDVVNLVEGGTQQLTLTGVLSGDNFTLPINADVASFTCENDAVANISATGLASFNSRGANCTATLDYTLFGTTRSDTFLIRTFGFDAFPADSSLIPPTGNYTSGYFVNFTDSNGQFLFVEDNSTFALENLVDGVTIDPNTGDITTNNAAPGNFNVIVTWVDGRDAANNGSGLTFQDTIQFTISNNPN